MESSKIGDGDDFLCCSICCYQYDETQRVPTGFLCGHTYCATCVETIRDSTCPDCRSEFLSHKVNFELLRNVRKWNTSQQNVSKPSRAESESTALCSLCSSNPAAVTCRSCKANHLCQGCDAFVHQNASTKSHVRVPWSAEEDAKITLCAQHNSECLIFCTTCRVSICILCSHSNQHKQHATCLVSEEVETAKHRIRTALAQVTSKTLDLQAASGNVDKVVTDLTGKSPMNPSKVASTSGGVRGRVKNQIVQNLDHYIQCVQRLKTSLLNQADALADGKQEVLMGQLDAICEIIGENYKLNYDIQKSLSDNADSWVLDNEQDLTSRVLDQVQRNNAVDCRVHTGSDIAFEGIAVSDEAVMRMARVVDNSTSRKEAAGPSQPARSGTGATASPNRTMEIPAPYGDQQRNANQQTNHHPSQYFQV